MCVNFQCSTELMSSNGNHFRIYHTHAKNEHRCLLLHQQTWEEKKPTKTNKNTDLQRKDKRMRQWVQKQIEKKKLNRRT